MPSGQYRGAPLPEKDRQGIVQAYHSGRFIREICHKHHHSRETVRKVLADAGVLV